MYHKNQLTKRSVSADNQFFLLLPGDINSSFLKQILSQSLFKHIDTVASASQ